MHRELAHSANANSSHSRVTVAFVFYNVVVMHVCSGAKTLKNWFECSVPETSTSLDVYCDYSPKKNHVPHLLFKNILMRNREFILFGLTSVTASK